MASNNFMSIRNATIAMRQRKIGLFEQERMVSLDEERRRRRGVQGKGRKKEVPQAEKVARVSWRD